MKKNMGKTDEAGKNLSRVMREKAPESLKGDAEALEERRAAIFTKGVATFQGSTGGEDDAEGDDDSD